jgi:XTP/dITP diphosphohydrolase
MALASPEAVHYVTVGLCRGEVIDDERGRGGFGYDPIFMIAGTGMTMAELPAGEKNKISHRARALQRMLPTLLEISQAELR